MTNFGKFVLFVLILSILGIGVFFLQKKPVVEAPVDEAEKVEIWNKDLIEGNKDDLVFFSIWPNTKVKGLVSYEGAIKGAYFFEANILINILDVNKNLLKASNATATTDWMTTDPVEFKGSIDFTGLPKGPAYFEIRNDNASGLPEHDKFVLIPIVIE